MSSLTKPFVIELPLNPENAAGTAIYTTTSQSKTFTIDTHMNVIGGYRLKEIVVHAVSASIATNYTRQIYLKIDSMIGGAGICVKRPNPPADSRMIENDTSVNLIANREVGKYMTVTRPEFSFNIGSDTRFLQITVCTEGDHTLAKIESIQLFCERIV